MRLDVACSSIADCEHKTAPIDESGEYFAVGTPAMRGHRINYSEARRISRDTFDAWTRRLRPQAGDLLLAREAPVGPVVRLPDAANVAPGQRTVILRPDPDVVDSAFLYYALSSPAAQAGLLVKAEGSTVHHLNVPDIRSFEVWVPPLAEQRAIAEVLGALDDKIAANTSLAARADELVRHEYNAIDARRVKVGEVADSPRKGVDPAGLESASPYVGLEHLGRRNMWLAERGNAEDVTSTKTHFEAGDVLFGKLRPYFHKVVSAPFDGICSTDILVVRAKNSALSTLLLAAASSDAVIEAVVGMSEGTRMPRTSWKDLASVEIAWPHADAEAGVASRLESIRGAAIAHLEENRTLAATRDALLPQLMSGKLRVRDAEAAVSAVGV